jgi:hypothetical protein
MKESFRNIESAFGRILGKKEKQAIPLEVSSPHPGSFYDVIDYKHPYAGAVNENEAKFLEALNNLGNDSYWEQHPEAVSKMVIIDKEKED